MDAEIAGKLASHEQRIIGAEHRIKDLEETQKEIRTLTISVEKMAMCLQNMTKVQNDMIEEQKNQRIQIENLENKPIKTWESVKEKALATIVSTVVGVVLGFIGALVAIVIQGG